MENNEKMEKKFKYLQEFCSKIGSGITPKREKGKEMANNPYIEYKEDKDSKPINIYVRWSDPQNLCDNQKLSSYQYILLLDKKFFVKLDDEQEQWKVTSLKDGKSTLITKGEGRERELLAFMREHAQYEIEDDLCLAIREEFNMSTVKEKLKNLIEAQVKQIVLVGAPGTGKTYTAIKIAKEMKMDREFVQFHSSYDYTDFVEGFRPVTIKNVDGKEENIFVKMDGVFKKFCRKIVEMNEEDKNRKYLFIIDEINRADLSRVFGELMFCLEEGYRGKNNKVKTQYQNVKTYEIGSDGYARPLENDCFKDGFYVPENVYIIGTMNEIDQSVESFDFALRRRFYWINVSVEKEIKMAFEEMFESIPGKERWMKQLIDNINNMNTLIAEKSDMGLNSSYEIGYAYFKEMANDKREIKEKLSEIFENRIEPLLKEYCRGRGGKENELIGECKNKLMLELSMERGALGDEQNN